MKKIHFSIFIMLTMFFATIVTPNISLAFDPAKSTFMPYDTPENQGVDSQIILDTLQALENEEIHRLMIARNGKIIFQQMWEPYASDTPRVIHSLTKVFTNTAVGMAYTKGAFDQYGGMNAKVVDVLGDFKDENDRTIKEIHRSSFGETPEEIAKFQTSWQRLQKITLENLLTMRSGAVSIGGNQWRPLQTSWLADWFSKPMLCDPGTEYLYSSGNSYILSAMAQKVMGKDARQILLDNGFKSMGIKFTWSKSPEGICSGGNGVMANGTDLIKIGQLYLDSGIWYEERILSEEWCKLSLGLESNLNIETLEKYPSRYAFHWTSSAPIGTPNNNTYAATGVFGQVILVDPISNTVVVVLAGTEDSTRKIIVPNLILPIRENDKQLATNNKARVELNQPLSRWSLTEKYRSPAIETLQNTVTRRTFASKEPATISGKISPKDQQLLKIPFFQFDFTKEHVDFTMIDDNGIHVVRSGFYSPITSKTSMTGNYMHHQYQNEDENVVAYATWLDDNTLKMTWRYPQMAFVDTVTVTFSNNGKNATVYREVSQTSEVKSITFKGVLKD